MFFSGLEHEELFLEVFSRVPFFLRIKKEIYKITNIENETKAVSLIVPSGQ